MTVEYKDSKRIVALSTESLLTSSDYTSGNFTTVGSTVTVTNNSIVFSSTPSNSDNGQYKQITALEESDVWSIDFKVNQSSGNTYDCFFLFLSATNGVPNATGNNYIKIQTQGTGYMRWVLTKRVSGTNTSSNASNNSYSYNTDYYGTLSSDGTNITLKIWTSSARSGSPSVTLTVAVSGVGTMNYIQHRSRNSGDSNTWSGTVSEVALSRTPAKPTDVQNNSLLVEKDTAKRYWFDNTFSKTGLKAYYNLNESSGNLINQSTTGDGLGSNADGTASGDPTYSVTGKVDNAISFDGDGDKFTLGTTAGQWNFLHNNSDFSVSFWLKLNATPSEQQGIMGTGTGGSSIGFDLKAQLNNNGRLVASIENGAGATASITSSDNFIPQNTTTWYHYVLTFSNGSWNIYRNGGNNESASSSISWSTSNHSRNMELANANANTPTDVKDLTGELDEVSIWNRVLTSDEISALYNSGSGVAVTDAKNPTWTFRITGAGIFAGGHNGSSYDNTIDYISIPTLGNATDFGDLTLSRNGIAGMSNGTRGVFAGGATGTYDATNVMDYVTISTAGNATYFGDISEGNRARNGGASNDTRGLMALGDVGGGGSPTSRIDYITIATTGNSTNFGNATTSTYGHVGVNNDTRACFSGGWTGTANVNIIDYVTIATTGNATDFGDLLSSMRNHGGNVNSSTRGIYHGGYTSTRINVMQYITIASAGNATDFGDLSSVQTGSTGVSSETRGVIDCGYTGSAQQNNIEYVTIATTGNSTDFGDSTVARNATGGVNE